MRKTIALSFVLALGMVVMAGCGGDGTVVDTKHPLTHPSSSR